MSHTEQQYAQIEKEFLAIIYACKKYHNYIYGRSVVVKTDHKPLTSIMEKELHKISSSKLQRMRIKLLNYRVKVEYLPGKFMYIADCLSRNFVVTGNKEEDTSFTKTVLSINISSNKIEDFKRTTMNDPILKAILNYCQRGWPNHQSKVPETVRSYYKFRNDIIAENGILYLDDKIIVPQELRPSILKLLHESHLGIFKTKKRAKALFYWPSLSTEVENLVTSCLKCATFQNSSAKEPMIAHEIPDLPFNKVGCDIFDFNNRQYLVVVDYFSKWIECRELKNKTSAEVIRQWINIFSTFGIPQTVIADNVPFNSYDCRMFANQWNFEIITSSPHYPRSNGLAERSVQILKNILKKSKNYEEFSIGLLEYRNVPTKDLNFSPAQLLMNRIMRTKLPISNSSLKPKINKNAYEEILNKSLNNKSQYDKRTQQKGQISVGDRVFMQDVNKKTWKPGTVLLKHESPRSYIVQSSDNSKPVRRNTIYLTKDISSCIQTLIGK